MHLTPPTARHTKRPHTDTMRPHTDTKKSHTATKRPHTDTGETRSAAVTLGSLGFRALKFNLSWSSGFACQTPPAPPLSLNREQQGKRVEQVRDTRTQTHLIETHTYKTHLSIGSHTIGAGREVVFHFGALALALGGRTRRQKFWRITGDSRLRFSSKR